MAVVDRDHSTLSAERLEEIVGLDAHRTATPASPPTEWSWPARVVLAVLLLGAGAIHLAMTPSHASEWLPEGIAFAVAAWVQIGLAVALLVRPTSWLVRVACLANVLFIGAWVVTRVWGWPFGPEAGVPHAASFVDVACVVMEVVAVLVGYELLAHPRLAARLPNEALVVGSVIPLAVLAFTTAAIVSPSASGHVHLGDEAAAGHTHDHGTTEDDKGLSLLMNGAGEGGGHVHNTSVVPVDDATQAQLDAQLAAMQPFIDNYPTVKDAEAAGYRRQGPYSPGLGAHYAKVGGRSVSLDKTMTPDALASPTLIYDGVEPDSKLAGFMYLIFSTDTQNPPEGFAGPNDHWHFHTNVCIKVNPDGSIDAPLGADTSAPKELCDKYSGVLVANTGYMVHVWPVPGYESEQGLFSNLNSKLTCPDGTYYTIPMEEIGLRKNICKDVADA